MCRSFENGADSNTPCTVWARGLARKRHVRPDTHTYMGDLVYQTHSGWTGSRAAGEDPCLGPGLPEGRLAEGAAATANSTFAIWT